MKPWWSKFSKFFFFWVHFLFQSYESQGFTFFFLIFYLFIISLMNVCVGDFCVCDRICVAVWFFYFIFYFLLLFFKIGSDWAMDFGALD